MPHEPRFVEGLDACSKQCTPFRMPCRSSGLLASTIHVGAPMYVVRLGSKKLHTGSALRQMYKPAVILIAADNASSLSCGAEAGLDSASRHSYKSAPDARKMRLSLQQAEVQSAGSDKQQTAEGSDLQAKASGRNPRAGANKQKSMTTSPSTRSAQ